MRVKNWATTRQTLAATSWSSLRNMDVNDIATATAKEVVAIVFSSARFIVLLPRLQRGGFSFLALSEGNGRKVFDFGLYSPVAFEDGGGVKREYIMTVISGGGLDGADGETEVSLNEFVLWTDI